MAAKKVLKDPVQKLINFERDELEKYEDSLPRHVSLAEGLRALVEADNKKNEKPQDVTILGFPHSGIAGNTISVNQVNESLDSYMRKACEIEDPNTIATLEAGAYGYHNFLKQRYLFLKRR